jgi:heptosyltransferase III
MQTQLLIRPGAIGDFILSLPALELLASREPTELWAASQNLPLARFEARKCSIVSTGLDLLGVAEPPPKLIERLRRFDSIVSWYGAKRPEFREMVAALGLPFRFLDALPPADAAEHAADFYLRQVGGAGTAVPRIECSSKLRQPESGFAVIHPFSGSARKNWPLDRYRELAVRLSETLPVRWCVGPEPELPELPDAVRLPDLYDLACWLSTARLYIGNDSGITHLAAAVGVPVVALFSPTNPRVWGPRGRRVKILHAPLDLIRVESVFESCRELSLDSNPFQA